MICWGCKRARPVGSPDPLGRSFCAACQEIGGLQGAAAGIAFLAATVPFEPGDRVDCRLAGTRYEGRGTVEKVSMDPTEGGTVINPIFRIAFDPGSPCGKAAGWHCEGDLSKVDS